MASGDFSQAIARLVGSSARWLIALDFDGTLAPIVERPEDARLEPQLAPLLTRLQEVAGSVAVISGRPRAFLETQLPPGVVIVGSYGLELPSDLSHRGKPERFDATAAKARLLAAQEELEPRLPAGSRLEAKPFGLVLHYRGAGAGFNEAAASSLVSELAARHGLEMVAGRLVLELKPQDTVDKGWALALLAARLEASAVVFVGDDLGDVPAWEATHQLGQRVPALAVGIASSELPADALDQCDLVLTDRSLLAPFLEGLIEAAGPGTGPG